MQLKRIIILHCQKCEENEKWNIQIELATL